MLIMKYVGQPTEYDIAFKRISENVVQILGDAPIETVGFQLSRDGKEDWEKMDYSTYRTVYREIEGGVQFSNDGSIYVEPIPVITFSANGGGILEGETRQEAKMYEELVIPTPIANEDYEFSYWSPSIPESGEIGVNKTFTAIFTSTLPLPEPGPTLEDEVSALKESVSTLEDDVKAINSALGGAVDE